VVASFQDEKAEQFLRAFILRKSEEEEQIQEALALLKEMNAKEPYLAYLDDNIVEVSVKFGKAAKFHNYMLEEIPEMVIRRLKTFYLHDCENDIRDTWAFVTARWDATGTPRILKPEGWAAALELFYRTKEELPVKKTRLAADWQVSYTTMMKNYNFISKLFDEFWE
jgi:hypothetical protein